MTNRPEKEERKLMAAMNEQERRQAALGRDKAAEAKKREPATVDWDAAYASFRKMMRQLYR